MTDALNSEHGESTGGGATCRDLGAPNQLTKAQVATIKSTNNGAPLTTRTVKIGRDGEFEQQFGLRDNDVVMVTLNRQK